jgi:rod shape-determining protein MreD
VICAVGFIRGEKSGAILGLFGGILVDCLGGSGFSLSPVLYTLCGYLCGALVGWFLSTNLPSFIVFSAIAGALREIFTVIQYGLLSEDFSLWQVIKSPIIPEYFAYILCVVPAYLAVLGICKLFKVLDIVKERNR